MTTISLYQPLKSGFDSATLSNEQAILLVRSMAAAAASNHHFDEAERMRITLGLRNAGEVALRRVEDDIDTDGLKIQ